MHLSCSNLGCNIKMCMYAYKLSGQKDEGYLCAMCMSTALIKHDLAPEVAVDIFYMPTTIQDASMYGLALAPDNQP